MNTSVSPYPPIDVRVLERASRVIRVLGHPLRLRLLELLETGERNVTELVLAAGVGQAAVSQQLRILRAEGVVGDRRDGPRVFYRITEPKVSKILACIRECDIPDLAGPSEAEVQEVVRSMLARGGERGASGATFAPSGAR